MRRATILAALAIAQLDPAIASGPDQARRQAIDALRPPATAVPGPGCAIGVGRDGRVDHLTSYGIADLSSGTPITPATVFNAASITKQVTAFAIALLEARGQLAYSDRIRAIIPELPAAMDAITIDQLIHHTNGIREQGQLLTLAGWRGADVVSQDDVLRLLTRQTRLNFPPGTEVVYGNAAYTLMAIIVQRRSGLSLRAFAAKELFGPLGMTRTSVGDDYGEVVDGRASSYVPAGEGRWRHIPLNVTHAGSTGLLTTVGDLLKWQQNLLDGKVGGRRLVEAMRVSGALVDGTRIGYGHGLRLGGYRGVPMVGHDGVEAGFRAESLLFPDRRLTIAVLCNGATADPGRVARRVADLYLDTASLPPALAPAVTIAPAGVATLAGTYWSAQTDELIDLRWTGTALRPVGALVDLVPIGADRFRPTDQPHDWRFGRNGNGTTTLSLRDSWPTRRDFVRIVRQPADPTRIAGLAGRYRSAETETTYTVALNDGRLRLMWSRGQDQTLEPVDADRFSAAIGTVTILRDGTGAVAGLTISNRRLRRFHAVRIGSETVE